MTRHPSDAIGEFDLIEADEDEEPRCAECGCGLFTDEHDPLCSYGDDEANEEDEDA